MTWLRSTLNTAGMLLLAVAIFYSQHFWPQQLPLLPTLNTPAVITEPDYFITEFHAIDLNETGRMRYELTAARLTHYPQPERADLVDPDMIFYRHNNNANDTPSHPWQLTAKHGQITGGGEQLDLSGQVKVTHLIAETMSDMTMETEQLSVFGSQEIATTNAPITLRSTRAELHGVGMKIDMKQGQMHLLSQVKGNYAPAR